MSKGRYLAINQSEPALVKKKEGLLVFAHVRYLPSHGDHEEDDKVDEEDRPKDGNVKDGEQGRTHGHDDGFR